MNVLKVIFGITVIALLTAIFVHFAFAPTEDEIAVKRAIECTERGFHFEHCLDILFK